MKTNTTHKMSTIENANTEMHAIIVDNATTIDDTNSAEAYKYHRNVMAHSESL